MGPRQEGGRGGGVWLGWPKDRGEQRGLLCSWKASARGRRAVSRHSPTTQESVLVPCIRIRDIGEIQETGALTFGLPGKGLQARRVLS